MTTLEQIRAEIEQYKCIDYVDDKLTVDEVLQIIDKYTEKEPCDDAISREDAIHAFDYLMGLNRAQIQDILFKLPSVTQKPIECDDYCDKCKCDAPNNEKWDYCPNCGCRMVEPSESEE